MGSPFEPLSFIANLLSSYDTRKQEIVTITIKLSKIKKNNDMYNPEKGYILPGKYLIVFPCRTSERCVDLFDHMKLALLT